MTRFCGKPNFGFRLHLQSIIA